ncbi:MAG: right-handed parallel beta-helix repeat-containing protein, partial [Candidatus Thermoplasmatota archaeon]|nr:right-handed parallel beta-helix repeat-containing protein [Candidatus Thermoplasmatota archaeon]
MENKIRIKQSFAARILALAVLALLVLPALSMGADASRMERISIYEPKLLVEVSCPAPAAPTYHSGFTIGDETWGPDGNPHVVSLQYSVLPMHTLTILPGTVVMMGAYATLNIQGAMRAQGEEGNMAIFTRLYEEIPWQSINIWGMSNDLETVLSLCDISGAITGISVFGSSPLIEGCIIHHNGGSYLQKLLPCWDGEDAGIYCGPNSWPRIMGNSIHNNAYGVQCNDSSRPLIDGNDIYSNTYGIASLEDDTFVLGNTIRGNSYGIYVEGANSTIDGNYFESNQYGIYCYLYSSPTITNNTIERGSYGIYSHEYSSPTISDCTISNTTYTGIFCNRYSSPAITRVLSQNSKYGMVFNAYSYPRLEDCEIRGSTNGIWCDSYSSAYVKNTRIHSNKYGVYSIWEPTIFENCEITDNEIGIYMYYT